MQDLEERDAMADPLKQIVCFLVLAVVLASCTGTDIQNAALGAAKNCCTHRNIAR
jgi:hypothetical protein